MQVVFELPTADSDHKTKQQSVCDSHGYGAPGYSGKSENDLAACQANAGTDKTPQHAGEDSFLSHMSTFLDRAHLPCGRWANVEKIIRGRLHFPKYKAVDIH